MQLLNWHLMSSVGDYPLEFEINDDTVFFRKDIKEQSYEFEKDAEIIKKNSYVFRQATLPLGLYVLNKELICYELKMEQLEENSKRLGEINLELKKYTESLEIAIDDLISNVIPGLMEIIT